MFVCLRYSAEMSLLTGRKLTAYECKRGVGEEVKGHLVDQKINGRGPHISSGRVLMV